MADLCCDAPGCPQRGARLVQPIPMQLGPGRVAIAGALCAAHRDRWGGVPASRARRRQDARKVNR